MRLGKLLARPAGLLVPLALASLLALPACDGDEKQPPSAAPSRAPIPRLARDTVLAFPRSVVWSAALRAAADAGYRLAWFDAKEGTAEVVRDSTLWLRIALPAPRGPDSARTRLVVAPSSTPTFAPAGGRARAGASPMPDDTAAARAFALVRAAAAISARSGGRDLLADSATIAIGKDTVEACRGAFLGEYWVEIDHRRVAGRCATPQLFGIERNVAVMQQVQQLPVLALVETCSDRARIPRAFTIAYTHHDDSRCGGRSGSAESNVLVLRKLF